MDIVTGKVTKYPAQDSKESFLAGGGDLAPGGKYLYFMDPNVYVYDLQTLQLVSKKELIGVDILSHSFCADGSRYANITGARIFISNDFQQHDPQTTSIVRIHDTRSGQLLSAFPSTTRWSHIELSPDGQRVASANDDGTIEVWPIK